MEVIVYWANQDFLIKCHTEKQNKQKTKHKESFAELTGKYLKLEEYLNIDDGKLLVRNYFAECSEVLLQSNFVISDIKVYLMNVFILNIHKGTSLLYLSKPLCH